MKTNFLLSLLCLFVAMTFTSCEENATGVSPSQFRNKVSIFQFA